MSIYITCMSNLCNVSIEGVACAVSLVVGRNWAFLGLGSVRYDKINNICDTVKIYLLNLPHDTKLV